MLQRDYILRLIREFTAALARMLEKKEIEDRRRAIKDLYRQYIGDDRFYRHATIDKVMLAMEGVEPEERLYKMEMLAELYYHEADLLSNPERDELLNKAFALFDFIDTQSSTFSLPRKQKMETILSKLHRA